MAEKRRAWVAARVRRQVWQCSVMPGPPVVQWKGINGEEGARRTKVTMFPRGSPERRG